MYYKIGNMRRLNKREKLFIFLTMQSPILLKYPDYPEDLEIIRRLFKEYQEEIQADLCFQSFEEELKNLPGKYAEPKGSIILAEWENNTAGVVALRPMETPESCEMKRLYVRPEYKGKGIGRALTERIIKEAKLHGYKKMRLDTLDRLERAVDLYKKLGFKEITAYYPNPLDGVVYMEMEI